MGATPFRTGYKFALAGTAEASGRGALTVDRCPPLFGLRCSQDSSVGYNPRNLDFKGRLKHWGVLKLLYLTGISTNSTQTLHDLDGVGEPLSSLLPFYAVPEYIA